MWRFLLGVIVGAAGFSLLRRSYGEEMVNARLAEVQEKASSVLAESRRILEETRHELSSALDSGRKSLEAKSERLRRVVDEEESTEAPSE